MRRRFDSVRFLLPEKAGKLPKQGGCPVTKKKCKRVLAWAAVLAVVEVAVCNIHWIEYRFLGGERAAFTVPPVMIAAAGVILGIAAFQEELEQQIYRLDGRFFGKREQYVSPQASVRYERLFAWLALVFGLLFVFLIPPMSAPDETNHFTRAFLLAHGQLFPMVDASQKAVGTVTPDLPLFLRTWNASTSAPGSHVSFQTVAGLFTAAASPQMPSAVVDYPYPYLSFFLYIPQALGIVLGEALFGLFRMSAHYNIYLQLLFARMANLGFYIGAISLVIRITPFFKRTLTILMLMPMAVFIASSCSYDVFLYSFCLLYLAYVLKCAYDPTVTEIKGRQLFVLILLQFCILLGKYVYFPLLLLIFLIPREKFHSQPKRKILLATALPSAVCLTVWLLAYKISTLGMAADPYANVYREQAQFVLFHPVQYAAMLLDNLYRYRQDWVTGFVGLFGWLNAPLPLPFVLFYVVLLIVSAMLEVVINRTFLSRRMLAFVSVMCYILVATAEYIVWTPSLGNGTVGQLNIIGVQGRYFIPFAFPILLLLANKWAYRTYTFGRMDMALHRVAVFIISGSLAFSIYYVLHCYWLPS
ncbi:DUF2142 domain-containing protein [Ethanoligenens harbinense]|nr:DUF2142 domain-containing protein [Ethanoligenens harbinense YUAN-3]AYF38639.1 DUF2142 domain-containing protein [Ethanoligenens harbinense]AYF41386.1 DUF2142 domain-containing protein [Ethanoligenens harbinense]QCN92219.1 DUF2142 domain-containing protein [Ethanoligenens harbinense]